MVGLSSGFSRFCAKLSVWNFLAHCPTMWSLVLVSYNLSRIYINEKMVSCTRELSLVLGAANGTPFPVESYLVKEDRLSLMDLRSKETLTKIVVKRDEPFKCCTLSTLLLDTKGTLTVKIVNALILFSYFSCLLPIFKNSFQRGCQDLP